jgi:hypothetical protein
VRDDIIDDISETDPSRIVVEIDQRLRPKFENDEVDTLMVLKYYDDIRHACEMFGLDFQVVLPKKVDYDSVRRSYYDTISFIDQLRITILHDRLQTRVGVALDEGWRTKIHSYIESIRQIVQKTNLEASIKEGILKKLHALDAEVDRERSNIQVFSDAPVGICEGISSGTNALKPAAALLERVIGALARLKSKKPEMLALPKPDELGLDSLGEVKKD